jgi:phosphatidate cytidylyltransferase
MSAAPWRDPSLLAVGGGLVALLTIASVVAHLLARRRPESPAIINLRARVVSWWWMAALVLGALAAGFLPTVLLFALLSFLALREFITLAPTRLADHRALFWAFFVILPAHYALIAWRWYGLVAVFIPVYAFAFTAIRAALAGDSERFLERNAKVQFGLMLCVYALGHLPAFLLLTLPSGEVGAVRLLLWLVLVVQLCDVLQYVWGRLCGRRPVLPRLSPNKTWAGFVGGVLSASAVGAALWWLTPFAWWQAGALALLATLLGFCGGAVMSAIKRDAGVKDFGASIGGHGGVLDRLDSLVFSAPVVFHLVRWQFGSA